MRDGGSSHVVQLALARVRAARDDPGDVGVGGEAEQAVQPGLDLVPGGVPAHPTEPGCGGSACCDWKHEGSAAQPPGGARIYRDDREIGR